MTTLLPERRRIRVSGGELSYVDMGEGAPVLLVHGFPTSSLLWRDLVWPLAGSMRVVAPDLLGYGDSEKPLGADLSEPAQAGYLRELLAALGITELAVVGHDIGGALAQMLALDPGPDVRAMVLVDSASFDAWPIEGVKMLQGTPPDRYSAEFVDEVVRLALDLGMAHHDRLDEETVKGYVGPWLEEPAAFFRAARAITGSGLAGREDELSALDIPVLAMWGEDDPFLGSELAERLGEVIPGCTVALLPGCSHFLLEDAPQTAPPLIHEYLRARYLHETHSHASAGPVPVYLERPPGGLREDFEFEVADDEGESS